MFTPCTLPDTRCGIQGSTIATSDLGKMDRRFISWVDRKDRSDIDITQRLKLADPLSPIGSDGTQPAYCLRETLVPDQQLLREIASAPNKDLV
jgi:hypothetical protein